MTTTTTRNLAREVAEALVSLGKLKRETMQEGYYNDLIDNGIPVNFSRDIWITILDGDEVLSEMHPDYPNNLNACARDLTREGYRVVLVQVNNEWAACFETVKGTYINGTQFLREQAAVAWCESFLALCKHVDGKAGEGR